jgi:transcriptional regulator with GAF, ATPase, and Fis domain
MHQFRTILDALAKTEGRRSVLEQMMDLAISHLKAERGLLVLARGKRKTLKVAVARNMDKEPLQTPSEKFSRTIVEQVIELGETVLLADAGQNGAFAFEESVFAMRLRSVLCAPVFLDGLTVGAIYVDNRFVPQKFGAKEASWVEILAAAVSLALIHKDKSALAQELEAEVARLKLENTELRAGLKEVKQIAAEVELTPSLSPALLKQQDSTTFPNIIGRSQPMQRMFHLMERVLDKDITVLIQGESGTGKELVAKGIHDRGIRHGKPMIAVNCGAIPENLIESELFGHMKGAFTDASQDKVGLVQAAEGGTLFLDEIGEMPLPLQTRLLRFLQSGEYQRVGSHITSQSNVRVIAASNKDLAEEVKGKRFREDLYYRLNIIQVVVPPLRTRQDDIPLLVEHFLEDNRAHGTTIVKTVAPAVIALLSRYQWPGNVRELEMVLKNASLFADEEVLSPSDFEQFGHIISGRPRDPGSVLRTFTGLTLYEIEREVILHTLKQNQGNKKRTAELLGIDRRTLYNKLGRYEGDGVLEG